MLSLFFLMFFIPIFTSSNFQRRPIDVKSLTDRAVEKMLTAGAVNRRVSSSMGNSDNLMLRRNSANMFIRRASLEEEFRPPTNSNSNSPMKIKNVESFWVQNIEELNKCLPGLIERYDEKSKTIRFSGKGIITKTYKCEFPSFRLTLHGIDLGTSIRTIHPLLYIEASTYLKAQYSTEMEYNPQTKLIYINHAKTYLPSYEAETSTQSIEPEFTLYFSSNQGAHKNYGNSGFILYKYSTLKKAHAKKHGIGFKPLKDSTGDKTVQEFFNNNMVLLRFSEFAQYRIDFNYMQGMK
jgi:hypothetical protein